MHKDNLRSNCDLMYAFFVLDDQSDRLDAAEVRLLCDACMDAIENPGKLRPEGEPVVGEISRQSVV